MIFDKRYEIAALLE